MKYGIIQGKDSKHMGGVLPNPPSQNLILNKATKKI